MIEKANQEKSPLSIILLDIDHFKQVNDQHGHSVGDQVLVAFANLVKEVIPKNYIFGRWGGEEFLLICPETSEIEALPFAEHICSSVESHDFPVVHRKTCSLGVATYHHGESMGTLLSHADKGLYHAKETGRNKAQFWDMGTGTVSHLNLPTTSLPESNNECGC